MVAKLYMECYCSPAHVSKEYMLTLNHKYSVLIIPIKQHLSFFLGFGFEYARFFLRQ